VIIRLAFTDDDADGGVPLLVSAVDEYTEDNWGTVPEWHVSAIAAQTNVRECTIYVPDSQVQDLFTVRAIASSDLRPVQA
jgi:hypothetical protein